MATMLQLVQQVCDELSLPRPNAVASSANQDFVTILALMNATGIDLLNVEGFDWQALSVEYRFTTTYYQYTGDSTSGSTTLANMSSIANLTNNFMVLGTGINQDTYVVSASGTDVVLNQAASASGTGTTFTFSQTRYALPSDYDHLISRTDWDKSKHWEMLGPETPQQWQWLKSGYISTGPRIRFRLLGNYFQVWPPLSSNEYLGFEYVSKNWALDSSGTPKASFTADDDTTVYRDRLLVLGTKLKYFELKGFDTTALYRDYQMALDVAKAQDQDAPTLSMAPRVSQVLIGFENIPDSGYGT